jgi:hypothetical protein
MDTVNDFAIKVILDTFHAVAGMRKLGEVRFSRRATYCSFRFYIDNEENTSILPSLIGGRDLESIRQLC